MEPNRKQDARTTKNSEVKPQSQIEIVRELVQQAEKWSDLLLNYTKSMLLYFLPATVLAITLTLLYLYLTIVTWNSISDQMQFLNIIALLLLGITAILAVKKEAEALLRHRANKDRHRKWQQKFQKLQKTEKELAEMLTSRPGRRN